MEKKNDQFYILGHFRVLYVDTEGQMQYSLITRPQYEYYIFQ